MRTDKVVLIAFVLCFGEAFATETLCEQGEVVHFSCKIANTSKIVSVCSSAGLTQNDGYIQYRFGVPTAVELVYPGTKNQTQKKFSWSEMHPHQGLMKELAFKNGVYIYTVFSIESGELGSQPSQGVWVSKIGATTRPKEFLCSARPEGSFYLYGMVPYKDE